mmetsp:Transcript_33478/g.69152  ORF Transcript_33478/g.69152 Transcript_33478/m.69152 type:complete len:334 (+) Transcript_33478:1142-2143(+)
MEIPTVLASSWIRSARSVCDIRARTRLVLPASPSPIRTSVTTVLPVPLTISSRRYSITRFPGCLATSGGGINRLKHPLHSNDVSESMPASSRTGISSSSLLSVKSSSSRKSPSARMLLGKRFRLHALRFKDLMAATTPGLRVLIGSVQLFDAVSPSRWSRCATQSPAHAAQSTWGWRRFTLPLDTFHSLTWSLETSRVQSYLSKYLPVPSSSPTVLFHTRSSRLGRSAAIDPRSSWAQILPLKVIFRSSLHLLTMAAVSSESHLLRGSRYKPTTDASRLKRIGEFSVTCTKVGTAKIASARLYRIRDLPKELPRRSSSRNGREGQDVSSRHNR